MINELTFLAIKVSLKKAWVYIKKYWQVFLGMLIPIVLMIIFRKKANLSAVLDKSREAREHEIDAINKAHENEIKNRELSRIKYFETIEKIEEKYKSSSTDLEDSKRKEIEKVLKENEGDPDAITKKISDITGIRIEY